MPDDKHNYYIDRLTQNPDAFLASQETSTLQASHVPPTSSGSHGQIPSQANDTEYVAEPMRASPQQETVILNKTNTGDDVQIKGTTDTNQIFKTEAPNSSQAAFETMLHRNITTVTEMPAERLLRKRL